MALKYAKKNEKFLNNIMGLAKVLLESHVTLVGLEEQLKNSNRTGNISLVCIHCLNHDP